MQECQTVLHVQQHDGEAPGLAVIQGFAAATADELAGPHREAICLGAVRGCPVYQDPLPMLRPQWEARKWRTWAMASWVLLCEGREGPQ